MRSLKWTIFDGVESIILGYRKYQEGQLLALEKLVRDYEFQTVLDIGCGDGYASEFFAKHGKCVTAVDYGKSNSFSFKTPTTAVELIIGDFNTIDFQKQFDCIWCAHCLEHQLNVQIFLEKIHGLLREGGVLALTVPPLKNTIVGGHVSLWNAGLLLYRLVLAGFDCSDAAICRHGYNITVILKKKSISVLSGINYDMGDIRYLRPYWPKGLPLRQKEFDDSFYGWIRKYNW